MLNKRKFVHTFTNRRHNILSRLCVVCEINFGRLVGPHILACHNQILMCMRVIIANHVIQYDGGSGISRKKKLDWGG